MTKHAVSAQATGIDGAVVIDILATTVAAPDLQNVTSTPAETEFEALGYDSLAVLECAATLETRYGIEIPDDVLPTLRTPQELVDFIHSSGPVS